ncbi:hypothetical protein [Hyphomonas sp.]|uniref:hypothetical protein n=1 Tax=Hyphomonas sp. TaxID=87 RepID=UPI00391AC202
MEAPPEGLTLSGEARWSGIEAPATTRLILEIRDLTRPAENGDVILHEEFPASGAGPVAYTGSLPAYELIPGGDLVLKARLQHGYAILRSTDGDIDIPDRGEVTGLSLELFDPEELAKGIPRVMITPSGRRYTCQGEPLTIAIEAGAAYVTFGDGTSVKLPKTASAVDGVNQFSTGRFLVQQFMDPSGSDTLHFARGRAAALPCQSAQ